MSSGTRIYLHETFFSDRETAFLENGALAVSLFRFDSGVLGLRIKNTRGEVIILPFQGQQVWSCAFEGRELTMKSMFDQPYPTLDYLGTYGGFLLHCGATAMGVPSEKDTHPLHGELPNAPYLKAYIETGSDDKGKYVAVGGQYRHIVAFNHNYLAEPRLTLYENVTMLSVTIGISNKKHADMELMYMMHVNFRPVDNGELVYSAHCTPQDVQTHVSVPSHMKPSAGLDDFVEFMNEVARQPELHNKLTPDLLFDPEIVFDIKYQADPEGRAHAMQVHPDGYAGYISHRPAELDHGVRWISRSRDQDALGLVLPATAQHQGYTLEKEKGNIKILPPLGHVQYHAEMGLLCPDEVPAVRDKIAAALKA